MDTNNLVFKLETLKFEFNFTASLFDLKFTICDPMVIHCLSLMTIFTIDYIALESNRLVIRTNEYFHQMNIR